jgi:Eukaryotic porin
MVSFLLVCTHVTPPKLMFPALVVYCDSILMPMPMTPNIQLIMLSAGMNYLQSVTPRLALGGEAFWLGQQRKSGTGFAGRFTGDAFVATAQVATTGLVSLTYVQRISEKVRFSLLCRLSHCVT